MKHFISSLFLLMISSTSLASSGGIKSYSYWAPRAIHDYLKVVHQNSPINPAPQCQNFFNRILQKGSIDIRYALGYFDDSTGQPVVIGDTNYGLSPSLDIEIFNALRKELTRRCPSKNMRLCGFKETGKASEGLVALQKTVSLFGRKTSVRILLTHASASTNYLLNIGQLQQRQAKLTTQSEQNYFGGLQVADIVFYNGHSRNGGGPDFRPPVLTSQNKVNYKGYYERLQPGFRSTMASLKVNPNDEIIVGMFSCYSKSHFLNSFLAQNPRRKLILSADTIDYFDTLKASVGYLEALLRGHCGSDASFSAKQGNHLRKGFQDFNL